VLSLQLKEMNIFQKDEIGVPSTLVAVLANVFQAIGVDFLNVILTMIISLLSIVYLVFKIKNEKAIFDSRKKDEESK
jgi:predicted amino acid-binding ACT domain protein